MKQLVVGILAHVDAGKTTLSEGILLESGVLKKAGRIDNRDTFFRYGNSRTAARHYSAFKRSGIFLWRYRIHFVRHSGSC